MHSSLFILANKTHHIEILSTPAACVGAGSPILE
jgi:hypothetical protein